MEKKAASGIMLAFLLIGMLALAFNVTSVRAGATGNSIIAKPFIIRDFETDERILNASGNCIIAWEAETYFAYFYAFAYHENTTFVFTLSEMFNSSGYEIWGRWNVTKNGRLVVEEGVGKAYGLTEPVGSYFKLYIGNQTHYYEGWHFSGWILHRGTIKKVPTDYITIQEAINAANSGDTIYVKVGTYYEYIIVNKTVSLIGENKNKTIIDGNGTGIVTSVTKSDVTITGFTIRNGSIGIKLYFPGIGQSSNIMIYYNLITDMANKGYGILVYTSNSNRIIRNTILNSWIGIKLGFSDSNIISQNIISNNKREGISSGLLITPSYSGLNYKAIEENRVFENLIVNNECGMNITNRSGEIIWHNNFINNTVHAYILQQYMVKHINIWDDGYPSGGNYWSDYNGTDFYKGPNQDEPGSDGIGDTPYIIDKNNQDNYPLIEPWSPTPRTPFETLKELNQTIESWNLERGIETSLTSKLQAAYRLLNMKKQNASIRQLIALINKAEALRLKKLTTEQADHLTAEAQRIIDLIKE